VRIRAVEGPLLRGCAAADGRETAGYLFRRPGPGCHVARLLDEPTASLDPAASKAVEDVIAAVTARGIKVVMATHDLGSAKRLAGDIVLLHRGRIVETTAAATFFSNPATREARAFIAGELLV
jgi:ABC-type phosphate transport system ATPase subunit